MRVPALVDIDYIKMAFEESSDSMISSVIIELPVIEPMTKMLWKTLSYQQSRQQCNSDSVKLECVKVPEKSESEKDDIKQLSQEE